MNTFAALTLSYPTFAPLFPSLSLSASLSLSFRSSFEILIVLRIHQWSEAPLFGLHFISHLAPFDYISIGFPQLI